MLNNLRNVSLYLISMANIARFLGFSLHLVCFAHGNNVFKVFLFVMVLETAFLVAFGLWVKEKPCFFSFVKFIGRGNTVS